MISVKEKKILKVITPLGLAPTVNLPSFIDSDVQNQSLWPFANRVATLCTGKKVKFGALRTVANDELTLYSGKAISIDANGDRSSVSRVSSDQGSSAKLSRTSDRSNCQRRHALSCGAAPS